MSASPATGRSKGGTALKKCYLDTHRFSEDLDFTVIPGGPILPDDLSPILEDVLRRTYEESGIDFGGRRPLMKAHPSGMYVEARVYYTGPRRAPLVASVRLDLSASERIVRPTVLRPISHQYPDTLPAPATVRAYALDEVFAEKIRAMGERGRPRDLYDIITLFRHPQLFTRAEVVRAVLLEKCNSKGVPLPTLDAIASAATRAELVAEWTNMLGHQIPALPPFESVWRELPDLFWWLQGSAWSSRRGPSAVPPAPRLRRTLAADARCGGGRGAVLPGSPRSLGDVLRSRQGGGMLAQGPCSSHRDGRPAYADTPGPVRWRSEGPSVSGEVIAEVAQTHSRAEHNRELCSQAHSG